MKGTCENCQRPDRDLYYVEDPNTGWSAFVCKDSGGCHYVEPPQDDLWI